MLSHRTMPESHSAQYKAMLKRMKKAAKHFESIETPSLDDLKYLESILDTAQGDLRDIRRATIFNSNY